jgi:hypothetical protein
MTRQDRSSPTALVARGWSSRTARELRNTLMHPTHLPMPIESTSRSRIQPAAGGWQPGTYPKCRPALWDHDLAETSHSRRRRDAHARNSGRVSLSFAH